MSKELKFADIVSYGFKTGIKNLPSLLGCVVLWVLTFWIPYVNVGTTIAIASLPAMLSKGKTISPLQIFDSSYRKYMGEFFLANGFKNMMISAAALFMIIPGIIVAISYSLTTLIIVDKGKSASEALKLSLDATDGHKAVIFGWYVLFGIVVIGIPFWLLAMLWKPLATVWMIVASVAGIAAQGYIYKQLVEDIPSDLEDATPETPEPSEATA